MSTNYEYRVDPFLKINYEKIIGEVSILDIIKLKKEIVYSDDYQENYNLIVDIREATFTDFIQNIPQFTEFIIEISKFRNMNRKCAFLTTKPVDVVNSELVKLNLDKLNIGIKMEIFSTENAALEWLSNP